MSASPEFLRNPSSPPEFKLRPILTLRFPDDHGRSPPPSSSSSSSPEEKKKHDYEEEEEEECHTPTSVESKIPSISICPPAPKKPRPAAEAVDVSRRRQRRATEVAELFTLGTEAIQCLFRRRESPPPPSLAAVTATSGRKRKRRGCDDE